MHKWLITGANGNLGRRLILSLLFKSEDAVVAVVRSNKARRQLESGLASVSDPVRQARLTICELAYTDVQALAEAASGCNLAVHLVGVIKGDYELAHERSCQALLAALEGSSVDHITYMSIVGSSATAENPCLASKGAAEEMLLRSGFKVCVVQVPMVLGEGDYASFALAKRARAGLSFSFRGSSLEQPIYAGDVVSAVENAARHTVTGRYALGGPESLSRDQLTRRAAAVLGKSARTVSLPLWLGRAVAGLLEKTSKNPPVSRAMLEVLDHDDNIDNTLAQETLLLTSLTPLDTMLAKVLG